MLTEAITKWLDDDTNIPYPVYYEHIPQNETNRPVIIVEPNDTFDNGNTAKLPVPQKIINFCIRIVGRRHSDISVLRDLVVAKCEVIAGSLTPTIIGPYRCQCILIRDIMSGSITYSQLFNDRKQPGSPEQDFVYADILCTASYHRETT